jgi:hypothetical protein
MTLKVGSLHIQEDSRNGYTRNMVTIGLIHIVTT